MDQEQQPRERSFTREIVPDWRPTRQQKLWAVRIAIAVVVLLGILTFIGLPFGITLWEWLKLLIIPALIAGGGIWFNHQQRERELEIAREQRDREVDIADQRAQDEALQAYLDQMNNLLLEHNLRDREEESEVRTLARARTLTVLAQLGKKRKGSVIQFLLESGLITNPSKVALDGADLAGLEVRWANLSEVDLSGADLHGAEISGLMYTMGIRDLNLSRANLSGANLSGSFIHKPDLWKADLSGANLRGTVLDEANLNGANLRRANLVEAILTRAKLGQAAPYSAEFRPADLSEANLEGANLEGADLSDAMVSDEQLATCKSLEGATMPNGQLYEDWFKSKGRGADGEKSGSS